MKMLQQTWLSETKTDSESGTDCYGKERLTVNHTGLDGFNGLLLVVWWWQGDLEIPNRTKKHCSLDFVCKCVCAEWLRWPCLAFNELWVNSALACVCVCVCVCTVCVVMHIYACARRLQAKMTSWHTVSMSLTLWIWICPVLSVQFFSPWDGNTKWFFSCQAIHVNTSLVSSYSGAKTHVQVVGLFIWTVRACLRACVCVHGRACVLCTALCII